MTHMILTGNMMGWISVTLCAVTAGALLWRIVRHHGEISGLAFAKAIRQVSV